jgi:hypothetical protein
MWTVGKLYEAIPSGFRGGTIDVADDLGRQRVLNNGQVPEFPMGTSGSVNRRTHMARFERIEK